MKIFHSNGDLIVVGGGLQNLGPFSMLSTFEQGGGGSISIVPNFLWQETPVSADSYEGPLRCTTIKGFVRSLYCSPDLYRSISIKIWNITYTSCNAFADYGKLNVEGYKMCIGYLHNVGVWTSIDLHIKVYSIYYTTMEYALSF